MRIGAYQFKIRDSIKSNLEIITKVILSAIDQEIKLLVFPECSLTGYPPHDIDSAKSVRFDELEDAYEQIQNMIIDSSLYVVVGTITKDEEAYHNSAVVFAPNKKREFYHKRALWGWDKDNFELGNNKGVFEIEGWKIGIRICFEVRFPEFFRELYLECTDLNIILFYDVCERDNEERYDLIKSHIRTRAVENICNTLSVNTIYPYQTAPTALYSKAGDTLIELTRNSEELMVYDLENIEESFGDQGRREISDILISKKKY